MEEFRYLNYRTIFSSNALELEEENRACFREAFDSELLRAGKTIDYHIKVRVNMSEDNGNNYEALNITELRNYVGLLNKFNSKKCKFTYDIEKIPKKKDEDEFYMINVNIRGKKIYHKYFLTWIRFSYEFPYNMALRDAYRLRKETYRFDSIANLYNLAVASHSYEFGLGHGITNRGLFKTNKELIERLGTMTSIEVNNIYETVDRGGDFSIYNGEIGKFKFIDLEYWNSDKAYKMRLEAYKKNYKILKK